VPIVTSRIGNRGIEGTDEVTTILRTTLRLFGVGGYFVCPFNATSHFRSRLTTVRPSGEKGLIRNGSKILGV
jgi:hypothetical protein